MNAETTTQPSEAAATIESAEERRADLERRLDEAASILAETLLDMWRREHHARRATASEGAS